MENHIEFVDNPVDIELSQPTKSKFLFYLGLFGFLLFFVGCNYGLWTRSYKSTEKIEKNTRPLFPFIIRYFVIGVYEDQSSCIIHQLKY